jgi:hypothetical protein
VTHLTIRAESRLTWRWNGTRGLGTREDLKHSNFGILPDWPCTRIITRLSYFFSMLTSQICRHGAFLYPMAAFRMLFANIHHYSSRSDLLGSTTCRRIRSALSILCAAQFRAGVLGQGPQVLASFSYWSRADEYKSKQRPSDSDRKCRFSPIM